MSLGSSQAVFAIVINWNGGEENLRCLNALVAAGLDPGHIVFVDNGSVRGSHKQVRHHYPGLLWVQNPTNVGFAEAANQGAQRALEHGAEWLWFINNDLDVEAHSLAQLLAAAAQDPTIGLLAPRILLPGSPPRIWAWGGRWNRGFRLVELGGHGQPDGSAYQQVADCDFLTGAALLVRRDTWHALGGFEASYFAYMEDVELCQRARESGWRVVCVGPASAVHHASASTGGGYSARRKYMMALNTVRILRRRGSLLAWVRFLVLDVLLWPVLLVVASLRGHGRAALGKGLGIVHGLLGKRVTARVVEPGGSILW
ncbi:MAG: glycosyltransferase family 2 protein [Planctomycetes bacterium]|nr:glycosyltransferase family 2 protein [Planctomycetota bacterium]MCB9909446.1 glycosyltransferase family 2 protein [Planctomycetota bacterium]HPF13020.1 glycosyltransferase family 2 protein [Planctomycetota bacterium]